MRLYDEPPRPVQALNITVTTLPHAKSEPINLIARALPHVNGHADLRPHFIFRSEEIVKNTLANTTQLATNVLGGIRSGNLKRHIKTQFPYLRRHRIRETVASDTLFASIPGFGGHRSAQLFVCTRSLVMKVYPMRNESEGPDALADFIRDIGVPDAMRTDNSKMQDGQGWRNILRCYGIKLTFTEPHHPWQNRAELYIGRIKEHMETLFNQTGAPDELWARGLQHVVYVWNRTAHPRHNYKTPLETLTGDTPDISAILLHKFYDPVLYLDPTTLFPASRERTGRFVGVSENTGDALCYTLFLEDTKSFISRSVVRSVDTERPNLRRTEASNDTDEGMITASQIPEHHGISEDTPAHEHDQTMETPTSNTEPPTNETDEGNEHSGDAEDEETTNTQDSSTEGRTENDHNRHAGDKRTTDTNGHTSSSVPKQPKPTYSQSRLVAGQRRKRVTFQSVRHQ